MRHAYFPLSGFLSLVLQPPDGPGHLLEVGLVGREGMLGAELSLGVATAPFHVLVQGAGSAWRIGREALDLEMARSASLQTTLQRYLGVTAAQLATSAACLRQHAPSARLARWVLMSQDRAQAERFAVTPAFLTYMLGQGPRGVAQATRALQHRGLIDLQGDALQVMDRPGLEAAACPCYRAGLANHRRHLGH
ncbi:MAG TPA: Crp/Fnr family transcriptional regulator [Burkholderiaceae bacterium]|nr:Crp/Fnr family transcriptional regulator [Burkholderiaceae bacterium]